MARGEEERNVVRVEEGEKGNDTIRDRGTWGHGDMGTCLLTTPARTGGDTSAVGAAELWPGCGAPPARRSRAPALLITGVIHHPCSPNPPAHHPHNALPRTPSTHGEADPPDQKCLIRRQLAPPGTTTHPLQRLAPGDYPPTRHGSPNALHDPSLGSQQPPTAPTPAPFLQDPRPHQNTSSTRLPTSSIHPTPPTHHFTPAAFTTQNWPSARK
jgi:hypothetical protein